MSGSNDIFAVFRSKEAKKAFIQSTISSCNEVIEHYDFVINDISSEISNPKLQAKKEPVIAFLKEMRAEWEKCRKDAEEKLSDM